MSSTDHHYQNLFNRLLEGELSPQDTEDIITWLGKDELDSDAKELIVAQLKEFVDPEKVSPQVMLALEAKLPAIFRLASENAVVVPSVRQITPAQTASEDHQADAIRPAHGIHFLRTAWFKYAAAILITLGAGAYLWNNAQDDSDLATTARNKSLQTDVAPGGEKAVLTLADGTKIVLDNAANGNLAQQGSAQVVKLADGRIAYNVKGLSDKDIMWNTMSTPAGGQYQVTLPDGTRVWLNAASSVTYPVAFVSKKRQVKITGEVYFEVATDKARPFAVDVEGKSTVQVMGTSFNISSYTNEENIKTTLLTGTVKVSKATQSIILRPGEQAVAASYDRQPGNTEGISVVHNPDIEQTLAWKNGIFDFNGADLFTVMRQLERWYDIKVEYEGHVSNVLFAGKMYRNLNLSDVLRALGKMGLNFRLDGKMLIITE